MFNIKILGTLSLVFLPAISQALPITLNFSSEFTFSPNSIVASGGQSLGSVLQQSFGVNSVNSNTFSVSGSLVFDNNSVPVVSSSVTAQGISGQAAGYSNAVTQVSLDITGTKINANIPAINANANSATSGVFAISNSFGLVNPEIGASSISQVQAIVPSAVQTGNAALIGDNLPVSVTGPNGTTNITVASDFIGFSIGTTDINDFGTGFSTDSGLLSVSSLLLAVIGDGTNDLFSSVNLPSDDSFFNPAFLDTSIVSLVLELENGFLPIRLSGNITSFELSEASPVPLPATLPMFTLALASIGFITRRKKLFNT